MMVWSTPSHAYLDPGTGSIILQGVLASIAVAIGVLRLYWHRCRVFILSLTSSADHRRKAKQEQVPDEQ